MIGNDRQGSGVAAADPIGFDDQCRIGQPGARQRPADVVNGPLIGSGDDRSGPHVSSDRGEAGARAQDHITAALFCAGPDIAQPSAGWRSGPGPSRSHQVGFTRDLRVRVIDEVPSTVGQNRGDQQEELLLHFAASTGASAGQWQVSTFDAVTGWPVGGYSQGRPGQ